MFARPDRCCDRVRGSRRGAVNCEEVNYFFFATFFAPALAFVDFLAAFLVAISRDSCHLDSDAIFLGKSVMRPSGIRREGRPLKSIHRLSTTHSHQDLMSCAISVSVLILRFVRRVKRNFLHLKDLSDRPAS